MTESQRGGVILRVLSTLASGSTTQDEKREANQWLNKLKGGDLTTLLHSAGELCSQTQAEFHVYGFSMLNEVVQKRWADCTEQQKNELTSFASRSLIKVTKSGTASKASSATVARFTGLVLARLPRDVLVSNWRGVLNFAKEGTSQLDVVCQVGRTLCEEASETTLAQRDNFEQGVLVKTVAALGPESLKFFAKLLETNYIHGTKAEANSIEAKTHFSLVSAILKVFESWMDLVPLSKLAEANVTLVFNGLFSCDQFKLQIIHLIEKIVSREGISEHDVAVGIDVGSIAFRYLDICHMKRRAKSLDLYTGDNFENVRLVAQAVCAFAQNYVERMNDDVQKIGRIMEQALSIFKFGSMEIAVSSLPLWIRVLTPTRPQKLSMQQYAAIKKGLARIAKDLALCLFGLHEHMRITSGKDDNLQAYSTIDEFREKHIGDLSMCLSNLANIYLKSVENFIKPVVGSAIKVCNDKAANPGHRVLYMKKVALMLDPVSLGKGLEAPTKKMFLDIMQALVQMNVGDNMELARWYGEALRSCSRVIKLDKALCGVLVPRVIDILWGLPVPTAGLGLPMLSADKYLILAEARMNLCLVVRNLVEQAPKVLLPSVRGFRKKVDEAKRKQRLTIAEFIVFLEVATIAAQPGGADIRNETMQWCLKPVYDTWKELPFQNPRNDVKFAQLYVPIQSESADGSVLQMGGREHRWQLYHEVLLVSKVFARSSTKSKAAPVTLRDSSSTSPIANRLDLILIIGKIVRSIIDISEQQHNSPWLARILKLGASEAEAFATGSVSEVDESELQEALRVAGAELQSCRSWLQLIFERCGGILGSIGQACPSFWSHRHLSTKLPKLIIEKAGSLNVRYSSKFVDQVVIPWVKLCPQCHRTSWVLPAIRDFLPKLHKEVMEGWGTLSEVKSKRVGRERDLEEIAYRGVLQEQTESEAKLLEALTEKLVDDATRRKSKPVFDDLLENYISLCPVVTNYGVELLGLKNWSLVESLVKFCRYSVRCSGKSADIVQVIIQRMLPFTLELLYEPQMEVVVEPILNLATDILVKFISMSPPVRECLQRLPGVQRQHCDELANHLIRGNSVEQKGIILDFFIQMGGEEMRALQDIRHKKMIS
ncbi:hypothetical protein BSKO_00750 [Bryopsis sp. KO-2023]|nr:hypothetical protein BSKO_00750 [Bryopsis sp. KO-2023]